MKTTIRIKNHSQELEAQGEKLCRKQSILVMETILYISIVAWILIMHLKKSITLYTGWVKPDLTNDVNLSVYYYWFTSYKKCTISVKDAKKI